MRVSDGIAERGRAVEVGGRREGHVAVQQADRAAHRRTDPRDRQRIAQPRIGIGIIGGQRGGHDHDAAVLGNRQAGIGHRHRRVIQHRFDGHGAACAKADELDPGQAVDVAGFGLARGAVQEGVGARVEGDGVIRPGPRQHGRVDIRPAGDGIAAGTAHQQVVLRPARDEIVPRATKDLIIARPARQGVVAGVAKDAVVIGRADDGAIGPAHHGEHFVRPGDRDGDDLGPGHAGIIRQGDGEGVGAVGPGGQRLRGSKAVVQGIGPDPGGGDRQRAVQTRAAACPFRGIAGVNVSCRQGAGRGGGRVGYGAARACLGHRAKGGGGVGGDHRRIIGAVDGQPDNLRGGRPLGIRHRGGEGFGDHVGFGQAVCQGGVQREGPAPVGRQHEAAIGRGVGRGPDQRRSFARIGICRGQQPAGNGSACHDAKAAFAAFLYRACIAADGRGDHRQVIGAGDGDRDGLAGRAAIPVDDRRRVDLGRRLPQPKGQRVRIRGGKGIGPCAGHRIDCHGAIGVRPRNRPDQRVTFGIGCHQQPRRCGPQSVCHVKGNRRRRVGSLLAAEHRAVQQVRDAGRRHCVHNGHKDRRACAEPVGQAQAVEVAQQIVMQRLQPVRLAIRGVEGPVRLILDGDVGQRLTAVQQIFGVGKAKIGKGLIQGHVVVVVPRDIAVIKEIPDLRNRLGLCRPCRQRGTYIGQHGIDRGRIGAQIRADQGIQIDRRLEPVRHHRVAARFGDIGKGPFGEHPTDLRPTCDHRQIVGASNGDCQCRRIGGPIGVCDGIGEVFRHHLAL